MSAYRVPFNQPFLPEASRRHLLAAAHGGQLAGNGPFTKCCESALERLTGARKALLTGSCTHALEMTAILLDARPGDEVIIPSFSFVSTANAFAAHGLRPVFADCRRDTLNVDVAAVERLISPRTRAVVAMHYGGVSCELDALVALAARHHLTLIEDNAHGLFGAFQGQPLGSFGTFATQSFHETKNVTCGEGGALLINDPAYLERAEIIREKGTNRSVFQRGLVDKYTWVGRGSNYLLSELQAACLWGQLSDWGGIQRARHGVWARYHAGLRDWAAANDAKLPTVPDDCTHPAHVYYLLLPTAASRDRLIQHLKDAAILAVFHYLPLHLSPMGQMYGGQRGHCPVTEDISQRLLRLPLFSTLDDDDVEYVIRTVRTFQV